MLEGSALFSLRLSFQVAAAATFFIIIVGVTIAYFLAQRNFRGKELLDMLFTLPLLNRLAGFGAKVLNQFVHSCRG